MRAHFEIDSSSAQGDRAVLRLAGELDMATAPEVDLAIEAACEAAPSEVLVDLRALDFIDSAGLAALLRGRYICERHGCRYTLIHGEKRAITRVFEIAGLEDEL